MNLVDEFLAVADALRTAGIRYGVCGGIAVSIHGFVRMTVDIDLVISPADVQRALTAVAPLGFTIPALPMVFRSGTPLECHIQRVTKIDGKHVRTLDMLLADAVHEGALDDLVETSFQDHPITVVSRARLFAMKRASGRGQDLEDIRRLEEGEDDY